MSIPPLVCSSPPPPEQCEDDKDLEDFDLTYHLSREDDDDEDSAEYNFGNFSGYNQYPLQMQEVKKDNWPSINESDLTKTEEINDSKYISNEHIFDKNTPKFEENALEDLNLEVNPENIHSIDLSPKHNEADVDSYINECSEKNSTIQDQGGTDTDMLENIEGITKNDQAPELLHSSTPDSDNLESENAEFTKNISEITIDDKIPVQENVQNTEICNVSNEPEISNIDQTINKNLSDDEFGDFEDFQFTISSNSQVLSENTENPWHNNAKQSLDFGDFKADFKNVHPEELVDQASNENEQVAVDNIPDNCDDDFGEFDDFKSSENHNEGKEDNKDEKVVLASNVPMLSLHSSENELQIVDSINKILSKIFTEEIIEPQNDLEGKLESYLSETWGHLIDIDIRQPYIINWNNSLGQKTLLKALCIDSRNILFGPKWNYNMPKYATNLNAAPLQPQKQFPQSNIPVSESNEKVQNKEATSWIDPFTPDGQEYTYAEALLLDLEHLMATLDQMAHKHSTLKISELLSHACSSENENAKPESIKKLTDLDVISNETSAKSNKIYSSTINVQPLRHINLPDTHIFTPTDSETPRSKTIHYDNELPALEPQPVSESVKIQPEQHISNQSNVTDSEYWEFQGFKGTVKDVSMNNSNQTVNEATTVKTPTDNPASKSVENYQTQILQPIKLEPIIPTLNWPDPGEVKETFEDFSDFVSNSAWKNNEIKSNNKEQIIKTDLEIPNKGLVADTQNIEDEFETFQSAPMTTSTVDFNPNISNFQNYPTTQKSSISLDILPLKKEDCNVVESNTPILESKSVASSKASSSLQDFIVTKSSTNNILSPHINSVILQPTSSSSIGLIRSQNTTGQILQPLSLESYSQINWPNPGIDLQNLSRFNPINSLNALKSDKSASNSKIGSPMHTSANTINNDVAEDDIWGDFVSSTPKPQQTSPKKIFNFTEDDEWTDFVSSPGIKPQNGLNTISLNVHTNSSMNKTSSQNKFAPGNSQVQLDIPALNYITPKSNNKGIYMEKHFQNL